MSNVIKYINTLNELSIIKDYLFTLGTKIGDGVKKRTIDLYGRGHFLTPDGKTSILPLSKYAYPTDDFIVDIIHKHDPRCEKLMTVINSQLDSYTVNSNLSNLDMIEFMDNMRKNDCIKAYKHHGIMLTISDMTTLNAMLLCNKIDKILDNLELNKRNQLLSTHLNAMVTITKLIDHAVIFVAKHDITMFIYDDGDVTLCINNDITHLNMAALLVKTHDVIMELPHLLLSHDATGE